LSPGVPAPVVAQVRLGEDDAAGKAGQKLTETGKVELRLKITFTPAAGVPATQTKKVTLKLAAG